MIDTFRLAYRSIKTFIVARPTHIAAHQNFVFSIEILKPSAKSIIFSPINKMLIHLILILRKFHLMWQ